MLAKDKPTVVIIDEIALHFRHILESGDEGVRRSAKQLPVFLKNLFEVAMGDPNLVVIITLASSRDAYGRGTDELSEIIDVAESDYADRLEEAHSVLTRSGKVIQPATDNEIGDILKRRLFKSVDSDAAHAAGTAYKALYERHGTNEALTGGAEHPDTYGQRAGWWTCADWKNLWIYPPLPRRQIESRVKKSASHCIPDDTKRSAAAQLDTERPYEVLVPDGGFQVALPEER